MKPAVHPDPDQLSAYLLGNLAWSEVEKVEAHLDSCAACRSRAAVLDRGDDSFVSCLRGAAVALGEDPALAKLVVAARGLAPTTDHVGAAVPTQLVAGHELVRELARGGFGIVYLARHPLLNDLRAIKRPKARDGSTGDLMLARFRREVQAVGALRHDHIVRAHDAGTDDAGPYLVTEYLDGAPLSSLLLRHRPFPIAEACALIRQAALGLQAAHERGLIHRDVKPSNLMLARANSGARVVVIDWGLVKQTGTVEPKEPPALEGQTSSNTALGTCDYIAPEQARDARSVDARADIYSLGATFYCLLAGRPPYQGRPNLDKLLAHQREPFPPLERLRPDLPRELLAMLGKMVEKDPARRYATPKEVAEALGPYCGAEFRLLALLQETSPPQRDSTTVDVPGWPQRRRWVGWLVAAGASLLLVAVVVALAIRFAEKGPNELGKGGDDRLGGVAPGVLGDGPATPVSMSGAPGHCSSLVFTPDGLYAVAESGGGGVYVWDLRSRKLKLSRLHAHGQPDKYQNASGLVAVSPDGKRIATAGFVTGTNYMILLSLLNGKTFEREYLDYHFFPTLGRGVAFTPDSSRLAVVENGVFGITVKIVTIQTGKWNSFGSKSPVHSLAFSPDGKFLVTGGEEKIIRLWQLTPNRQEREFSGHSGSVDQVAFAADGQRLFSASSADQTLRVWHNRDVDQEAKRIDVSNMACTAFWPNGRALTGHADGTVVLWDLNDAKELKRFPNKGTQVTAVAISPDGHHALAAHTDRLVYLYRLPPPRGK